MAKADKVTAVADIAEQFKEATATVVTEYRGLTVANLAQLRRSLGESATYTVAKNTLVKRAAAEAGIDGLDELFTGPTAIAFVKGEAVDAAKAKWWTSQVQNEILDHCVQLHGGYGYMMEYPVARAFVDSRISTIYGGTTEIQKEIIGRSLGV